MSRVARIKKAQFMNICHHVPFIATLQIYSRLTPITLIGISSTSPKQKITPLQGKVKQFERFFKEAIIIKKHRSSSNCALKASKESQLS